MFGPEKWIEHEGVTFAHWDRWLLRMAADEADGLDALVSRYEANRRDPRSSYTRRNDAEAFLAQIVTLKERVGRIPISAAEIRGANEKDDKKLVRRAQEKLFEQGLSRPTPAMLDTLRKRLQDRARRGHWIAFPVSPAVYEPEMRDFFDERSYGDWRVTPHLASAIGDHIEGVGPKLESIADRMAFYRAAAAVIEWAMDRVDDSGGDMGREFESAWKQYLGLPWKDTGIQCDTFLRDLIEFSVWEDYGLVRELSDPFERLTKADAATADSIFVEVIAALRAGGFDYQEDRALGLRVEFLVARKMHDHFLKAAAEIGTRVWHPILKMAQAAMADGEQELAKEVFAAADRPGMHQNYLREQSAKMFGKPVIAVHLRAVK